MKASLQARKRKLKLFQNQKMLSILVKSYQFCLPSITTNIKDLLKPLTQQTREMNDFLNLHTKCIDPKLNLNNALSDIICDQDLLIENKIFKVKLEVADKENTFQRGDVKDLTVLLNAKIQTSSQDFKTLQKSACYKKTLMH